MEPPALNGDASERAKLLGPIAEHYLRLLDSHIRYLDDGHTTFLFLTRAGVRIREIYSQYLKRHERCRQARRYSGHRAC